MVAASVAYHVGIAALFGWSLPFVCDIASSVALAAILLTLPLV